MVKMFFPPAAPCHYKLQFFYVTSFLLSVFWWKRFWLFGHGLWVHVQPSRLLLEPAIQLLLSLLAPAQSSHCLLVLSHLWQKVPHLGTSFGSRYDLHCSLSLQHLPLGGVFSQEGRWYRPLQRSWTALALRQVWNSEWKFTTVDRQPATETIQSLTKKLTWFILSYTRL